MELHPMHSFSQHPMNDKKKHIEEPKKLRCDVLVEPPENPLEWYTLTETTNSILNELIAYTGREEFMELEKEFPDETRIDELQELLREIQSINMNPDNFRSARRMEAIIEKYAPVLRAVYDAASLVSH